MFILFALGCPDSNLGPFADGICDTTEESVDAGGATSLGFSATEAWDLLSSTLQYSLVWPTESSITDPALSVQLTPRSKASLTTATGYECPNGHIAEPTDEKTWVWLTMTADAVYTTTEGAITDAPGALTIAVESLSLDAMNYDIPTHGDGGWSSATHDAFEASVDESDTGTCTELSVGLTGPVSAASFQLSADCDITGDGEPEFSGAWLSAEATCIE